MNVSRAVIGLCDRKGGRNFLAYLATRYARQKTGLDLQIEYDTAWLHRIGDIWLADSERFGYVPFDLVRWQPGNRNTLEEHRNWWFYHYQPKPGAVIVDVGAGVGEATLLFSKHVGPTGRVISVEAHPRTLKLLQLTHRYNSLSNVTIVWKALGCEDRTVWIEDRPEDDWQCNTIGPRSESGFQVEVPGTTLDQLCADQGITHVDFLKMNIEGAERLAIQGMSKIIHSVEEVCISCHDFLGQTNEFYRTRKMVEAFLQDHQFNVCVRQDHPEPWVRDQVYGWRRE